MRKVIVLCLSILLAISFKANSQCTPTSPQHVYNAAFHEPTSHHNFNSFMCATHDTLIADTTSINGFGWQFDYGDAYLLKLFAGAQITIQTFGDTVPVGLTINDSLQTVIAGAHKAAAKKDTLIFTAPYTGFYYVVFDSNNVCNVDGQSGIGNVKVFLNNASLFNCPPKPSNDSICGAIALQLNTPQHGDNTFADYFDAQDTLAINAGFLCSQPNNTLWYKFTPTISGNYNIQTSSPAVSGLNAWLGVYSAANCKATIIGKDTCLAACTPGVGVANNTINMIAGNTYFIMMDGYEDAVGSYTIEMKAVDTTASSGINLLNSINNIFISPNPTNDFFKVHFAVAPTQNTTIQLLDITGRLLTETTTINAFEATIDVSKIVSGVYFVKVFDHEKMSYTNKLVKQ